MIKWNSEYDKEIRELVEKYPVHFTRMISSKGFKGRYENRSYLLDYINSVTPLLQDPVYELKTKVYWVLNHLTEFPRCHNPNCVHPELKLRNIKKIKDGYVKFCSKECQYSSDEWRKSVEDAVEAKYGVRNIFSSENFKSMNYSADKRIQSKKNTTKRIHKSFNASEIENEVYRLLCTKYSESDIIRQYSDDSRYPYNCDFYIKSCDCFIEYNGNWTHGPHAFDSKSEEDIKLMNLWKSKNNVFYNNAIKTWTARDVEKRNIAKINNLNYHEFWNIHDVVDFLDIRSVLDIQDLHIPFDRKKIYHEFHYFLNKTTTEFPSTYQRKNYIVRYFQQDSFYRLEKETWKNNPTMRNKLVENRIKYLNKTVDELTESDILTGFKKSGMIYGYSHFNPLQFKWFIKRFNCRICYDPFGGWGHRLLGSLDLEKYIYNDLSKATKENVDRIIRYFGLTHVDTHCNDAKTFVPQYDFDSMFTCPPYFNTEIYECGKFKTMNEYNELISSVFDLFYKTESCRVFGIVTKEKFLSGWNDYTERYEITTPHYLNPKMTENESLFVFVK